MVETADKTALTRQKCSIGRGSDNRVQQQYSLARLSILHRKHF